MVTVVVVSGGASVVVVVSMVVVVTSVVVVLASVVVVVSGRVVPVPVGAGGVTAADRWVVTVAPDDPSVVVGSTVEEVEVEDELDVVVASVVEVGRAVVDGEVLATCCLGDVSLPVATSNSRAAKAMDASAYRPTLKR